VDICYEGILTCTSIREPLCLGDKPMVGILEDSDEGYCPNYTGAPRHSKMESIDTLLWIQRPKRKTFDYVYMNELDTVITICFMKL